MFVREKRIGPYTYLYLVETVREGGKTKQRITAISAVKKRSRSAATLIACCVLPLASLNVR